MLDPSVHTHSLSDCKAKWCWHEHSGVCKSGLQAAFFFTGGKLRSTWRDPEKCKSPKDKDYNLNQCKT